MKNNQFWQKMTLEELRKIINFSQILRNRQFWTNKCVVRLCHVGVSFGCVLWVCCAGVPCGCAVRVCCVGVPCGCVLWVWANQRPGPIGDNQGHKWNYGGDWRKMAENGTPWRVIGSQGENPGHLKRCYCSVWKLETTNPCRQLICSNTIWIFNLRL